MTAGDWAFGADDDSEAAPDERRGSSDSVLLGVAGSCVLISGALLVVGWAGFARPLPLHFGGWLLASLLAFVAVAMQRRLAAQRRAKHFTVEAAWAPPAAAAIVGFGFAVAACHAFFVAYEVATRVGT